MIARAKSFVGGMVLGAGAVYTLRQTADKADDEVWVSARNARDTMAPPPKYGSRASDIVGLDAATLDRELSRRSRRATLGLRLAGGLLMLYGMTRRGRLATTARTLGMGLLTRGRRPRRATAEAVPSNERRRIVDIQKTFSIEAPVDQVYGFWSSYENFPLFMSNVREVEDLGEGRSRWSVRGPGGAPIRWTARLTEQRPNEVIAWRSEPGAMLENAGIVRFQEDGNGTRLDLRLCYRPPIGGAGQAVIDLLGSDPRAKLNEDLGRLKALLEATARSNSYGQESRS